MEMERRDFLRIGVALGLEFFLGPSCAEGRVNKIPWNAHSRRAFVDTLGISVTSAYWNTSKDIARENKDRYDAAWLPGIIIDEDGSFKESPETMDALIEGKPNLYIIQNYVNDHPEDEKWRPERASALIRQDNNKLRNQFARFSGGVNLDLENLTVHDNKNYHLFLARVRRVYDGPLIVSLHAKIRSDGDIIGLGKEMNYLAISHVVDAIDYMTLDYWPGNPEEPIGSLEHFRKWLSCLFEQKGIDSTKVIASIPTYMKISYLDKNGDIDEKREPLNKTEDSLAYSPKDERKSDIKELKIVNNDEGEFTALYKGEKVRGWMMTEDAFKARIQLLKEYGIGRVAFWYGDRFVERTSNLREIVYGRT